jgi:hypothetical protein
MFTGSNRVTVCMLAISPKLLQLPVFLRTFANIIPVLSQIVLRTVHVQKVTLAKTRFRIKITHAQTAFGLNLGQPQKPHGSILWQNRMRQKNHKRRMQDPMNARL